MKINLKKMFFILGMVTGVQAVAAAQSNVKAQAPDSDILMKCLYEFPAQTQDSQAVDDSLPKTSLGFKFTVLKNKNNEIAADVYSVNDQKRSIRQVGHAELAADLMVAEDSPFDFAITVNGGALPKAGMAFTATVDGVTLFSGESYTALAVNCKVLAKPDKAQEAQAVQEAQAAL